MYQNYDPQQVKTWSRLSRQYAVDLQTSYFLGHLGKVYRGFSFQRNELVTVKIIEKQDKQWREQVQALQKIQHHNVVGFYGVVEKEGEIYQFMEYCSNGTLKEIVGKGLKESQVLRYLRQIVSAMRLLTGRTNSNMTYFQRYPNSRRMTLQLDHLFLGEEGDLKLSPPDLSFLVHSGPLSQQIEWYDALYAAPEAYLRDPQACIHFDHSAVWSVGLILYEMLTGEMLFKKIRSYEELKEEWLRWERGGRKVQLDRYGKYHPIWNVLLNYMLLFSVDCRPTFSQLYTFLCQNYQPTLAQISQGTLTWSPQIQKIALYLQYTLQKHKILLQLCQTLSNQDLPICNQFKYLIIFCCIMRYLIFAKKMQENLERQQIKLGEYQLVSQDSKKHVCLELIFKQKCAVLQQKVGFYKLQLKNNIIPKITQHYEKRTSSQAIFKQLQSLMELIHKQQKGQSAEPQNVYEQAEQSILAVIGMRHGSIVQQLQARQLKIYYLILLTMLLNDTLPEVEFQQANLIEQHTTHLSKDRTQLRNSIQALASHIY